MRVIPVIEHPRRTLRHKKTVMPHFRVVRDKVYSDYQKSANMSLSELTKWSENPCSSQASIGRTAIERNLMLKSTPKSEWDEKTVAEAKKAISFNEGRNKSQKQGKDRYVILNGQKINCGSGRNISARNWAKERDLEERKRIEKQVQKAKNS